MQSGPNQGPPAERWYRTYRRPLLIAGPVILIVAGLAFYLLTGRYVSTDDAYTQAARTDISANVSGRVTAVNVEDNQQVHKGDVLFKLDPAPFQVAVDQANAQLDNARLQVQQLKATYRQRQAELKAATASLQYNEREAERQERLVKTGDAPRAKADQARNAADVARQQMEAAQQQLDTALAGLAGKPDIDPEQHPLVQQAKAAVAKAELDLSYTTVSAPDDGIVTKVEQLQAGDYVTAATPLFSLVSTSDIWIEANYKETDLAYVRVGQPATVKFDITRRRKFPAHVVSVSPGTGSTFSVLPAENATGNWVKVVQRLPVRLALDHIDPDVPLRAGLSATVKIDTGHHRALIAWLFPQPPPQPRQ